MEKLMLLNEDGTPTGKAVDREIAHRTGLLHATSQVFVYKITDEKLYILLQKRCANKDSYPNCWDISCAGHVPYGMDYLENAKKELAEELGFKHVEDEELTPVFLHKTEKKATFYGKPFHDRQFSMVYTLMRDVPAESVVFQKEEISAVKWFSYDEIMRVIDENLPGYCLNKEKFERVYESLKEKQKKE